MIDIIKRNGKKEPFDVDKIRKSIKKAFVDAGLSVAENKEQIEAITKGMVKIVRENTEITTRTIRKKILENLEQTKKRAFEAWKNFDRKYKKEYGMENYCAYCGNPIEHDGKEEYVQCSSCGEVSRYYRRKLRQTDVNEVPT